MTDRKTPERLGGKSPPDSDVGDSSQMLEVPLCLPPRRVGISADTDLPQPGAPRQYAHGHTVGHGVREGRVASSEICLHQDGRTRTWHDACETPGGPCHLRVDP